MRQLLQRVETKAAFAEANLKSDNMRPSEAIRLVRMVFEAFDVLGDEYWPLKHIREVLLDYMRALIMRYNKMSGTEKAMLSRLIVFEAAKRTVEEFGGNQQASDNYVYTVQVCEMIETKEMSKQPMSRFFLPSGTLSIQNLKSSYGCCATYQWLREEGSLEAAF